MGVVVLGMMVVAGLVLFSLARRGADALSAALGLWGLLTLLVFAPSGAVLSLVLADHQALGALLCAIGSISGFFTAFLLLVAAFRRARREPLPLGGHTPLVLVAHHALILVTFGAMPSLERGAPELAWIFGLSVPCAIGAWLGVACAREAPLGNRTRSNHVSQGGSHV